MIHTTSTARCHLGLGFALLMLHQLEQIPPRLRAGALVEQGLERGAQQLEKAVPPFRAALELYRQIEDPRGQAECELFLGTVEEQRGNLAAAADHYDLALGHLRALDDPVGVWLVLLLRGQAEVVAGRCREAPATFEEALDTIRVVVADQRLRALETLAAYSRQTYCPNALAVSDLDEVHPMIYRLVTRRLEALTLELAADFHRDVGHLETALTLAEEALGHAQSILLSGSTGPMHRNMAAMHLALARYAKAAEHLGQALEAARREARWEDEVAILRELAGVERRQGHFTEARARYGEVLEIAELMDAIEIESETRRDLRELDRAAGSRSAGSRDGEDPNR